MLRRKTRPSIGSRRLPLRLEAMEMRLAPAIFSVTNLNDSGTGSLRQAVIDANNSTGADTVLFQNTTGTITLSSGGIAIDDALTIFGPGAGQLIVSANNASRIFTISNAATPFHVGISGMTLTQGNSIVGGAISVEGNELELRDVALFKNQADTGGAINLEADSRLTMLNCSMTGNSANSNGGAVHANRDSVMIINSCTITGNAITEGAGGAFFVRTGSTLLVDSSSITSNNAINGGGIYIEGNSKLTLRSSTIARNTAALAGGGINALYAELDLNNSTISGNSARSGGGIFISGSSQGGGGGREVYYYGAGPAVIKHCTITGNTVSGPSASGEGGGIYTRRFVEMSNTIVAVNTADVDDDLHAEPFILPGQFVITFSSFYCMIQDKGNAEVDDLGGTIFGVAPLLGPLQNNGGPTNTVALLTGSRGINEADPNFGPPPTTDQRGFPRVASNRLDIGAFEVQPGVTPPETPPPTNLTAVGSGPNGDTMVRVYDNSGKLLITFQPYDTSFKGEIHVATGDINGDGVEDVVTGAGPGGGPHVQTFDGNAILNGKAERIISSLGSYFAYNPGFGGGVNVAIGDVNGDGLGDIITGAGAGGGPHVIAWNAATGTAITSFFAYDASFKGGVNVGAGDIAGGTAAEIVTGAGAGGGPHVRVFNSSSGLVKEFFAYTPAFTGGVYVAAGDVNGDGKADIVTGAGAGGGPHVKVFDGTSLAMIRSFYAFESIFSGGVRVAVGNLDADANAELILGAGPLGGPHVRFVDNDVNNTQLNSFYSIDKDFNGGVFVG